MLLSILLFWLLLEEKLLFPTTTTATTISILSSHQQQTTYIRSGHIIQIRTWTHLAFSGNLTKAKVVELSLEGRVACMTKVPSEDLRLQPLRMMDFNAATISIVGGPFDNLSIGRIG